MQPFISLSHRVLADMDRADRTRACCLHACLRYVERDPMTNSTLRERFSITEVKGVVIDDIWTDINCVNPMASEGTNYPTQKPEALLERI